MTYTPVVLEKGGKTVSEIEHKFANMYKWQIYTTDIDAKYIKVVPLSGSCRFWKLPLRMRREFITAAGYFTLFSTGII